MSSIDRIRRPGAQSFPVIRRSADPLQPESEVAEFAQALDDFALERISQVQEAEEVVQNQVSDKEKSQEQASKKHARPDEEEENADEEADSLVDLVI